MKPLPYVLGTDLVNLVRWDVRANPYRISRLAHRIFHSFEFEYIRWRQPELYTILRPQESKDLVLTRERFVLPPEKLFIQEEYLARLTEVTCAKLQSFMGGRWAAKEAARKAWGATIVGWKDVRVEVGPQGDGSIICEPYGFVSSEEARLAKEVKQRGCLSISHDGDYATATVIAEPLSAGLRRLFDNERRLIRNQQLERAQWEDLSESSS